MPAPVSTAAASSAKAADRCRASHPMTTAIPAVEPETAALRPGSVCREHGPMLTAVGTPAGEHRGRARAATRPAPPSPP